MKVRGALIVASAALALSGLTAASAVAVTSEAPVPHRMIAGGWQITSTETTPDGGATRFHYERPAAGADGTADAEIQWHAASAASLAPQIEAEAIPAAGTLPTSVLDTFAERAEDWGEMLRPGTAQAFISQDPGQQFHRAVGLWEEEGETWEVRASVQSLYMLERLLERVMIVSDTEWAAAVPTAPTYEGLALRRHARQAKKHAARKHHHKTKSGKH
jgi:hypothetical protein